MFEFSGTQRSSGETTGCRRFCCWQLLRDLSADWLLLPKRTLLMVQGNVVHGCYYPLSKTQLEWQIGINDFSKQAEREQVKIMQVRLTFESQKKSMSVQNQ